ncbi:MAG: TetR/AcrR family transcriptional regulator [Nannocystaceae bacterium]|nr:TetR/AcrR family transcriptional regulator [Nannocystaceae bacterium]
MGKGAQTRQAILDRALDLSSEVGLEGLTFGVLAKLTGMSKSGLYAHFDSKETLQRKVLDSAATRFIAAVLTPAFKERRGLPRIEKMFDRWVRWETEEFSGGCPFMAAATEFDDRTGPVRDHLKLHLENMLGALARSARIAVEESHFRTDLDDEQFAYEVWGQLLAYQHYGRLLGHPKANERARKAFRNLIESSRTTGAN